MPNRQWTLEIGKTREATVEAAGSSLGGNSVRVIIDYSADKTQADVLQTLDHIRNQIISLSNFPPA